MEARINMPRKEAIDLIAQTRKYQRQTEYVPLQEAAGRVAAQDILSNLAVPNVRCSRWDGISFSYDRFVESSGDFSSWEEGPDYIFTNTGIPLFRDEFDTMVMIEHVRFEDGRLTAILQPDVVRGQNIIPAGERIAVGECLVRENALIRPSHLNLLASGGVLQVPVLRRPRVAVLTSGNELVSCWDSPAPGQTTQSNSLSMCAKLREWGAEPVLFPTTKDDCSALQARLAEAAALADLIVIGGGSGKGKHDLLQRATEQAGHLFFSSVEHGPGKRTCFALVDQTPVIGLVGPPGGEEMTFDFYVFPAVRACLGQPYQPMTVEAVLEEDIPPHTRTDFYYTMKLRVSEDGTGYLARPLPHAGLDRSIAEHNGYLFVRKAGGGYQKGDRVRVEVRTGCEYLV